MSRIDKLRAVSKCHGIRAIAKAINEEDDADGLTEAEFTTLMMDAAREQKRDGESDAQCFARFYSAAENLDLRKAHQLTKASLVEVQPVEVGRTDTATDSEKAYAQLQQMAESLRASAPYLSVAQAFERVFTDQANAELSARAHRRPNAAHALH